MARRPTGRGVRRHRNYTIDEAARATGACKATVRRWLKQGLPAITDRRPTLILGEDLAKFLDARRATRQKCQLHECYCFSCREPRGPAFGAVEFFQLSASNGNLRALCEVCATVMHKRVAVARLDALKAIVDVTIREGGGHIGETRQPCPNVHFARKA